MGAESEDTKRASFHLVDLSNGRGGKAQKSRYTTFQFSPSVQCLRSSRPSSRPRLSAQPANIPVFGNFLKPLPVPRRGDATRRSTKQRLYTGPTTDRCQIEAIEPIKSVIDCERCLPGRLTSLKFTVEEGIRLGVKLHEEHTVPGSKAAKDDRAGVGPRVPLRMRR